MTHQNKAKTRSSLPSLLGAGQFDNLLEVVRALDRNVLEFFMDLYQIPNDHKPIMREQNRRLHDAMRDRLPMLLSKPAL